MRRNHRRDSGAGGAAVAVAVVRNAAPGDHLTEAILARLAIAEQQGVDADKPKVVQRLDDGNALGPRGVIGGGRDQRKRIVEMDDLRAMLANKTPHLEKCWTAPDRAAREL